MYKLLLNLHHSDGAFAQLSSIWDKMKGMCEPSTAALLPIFWCEVYKIMTQFLFLGRDLGRWH